MYIFRRKNALSLLRPRLFHCVGRRENIFHLTLVFMLVFHIGRRRKHRDHCVEETGENDSNLSCTKIGEIGKFFFIHLRSVLSTGKTWEFFQVSWSKEYSNIWRLSFFIFSFPFSLIIRTICNFDFITFMRLYANTVNEIVYEYQQEGVFLREFFFKTFFCLIKNWSASYT